MKSARQARQAIAALNGAVVQGRELIVDEATSTAPAPGVEEASNKASQ